MGYAQTWVELMDGAHQQRQKCPGILAGAHNQAKITVARLIDREILCRANIGIKWSLANVGHDADNFPFGRTTTFVIGDSLADSVLAREILLGELLIDDDDCWLRFVLGVLKESAAHQYRLERGQIVCTHVALIDGVVFTVEWPARESDPVDGAIALHGKHSGSSRRLH